MVDINGIVEALKAERDRISGAISALEGIPARRAGRQSGKGKGHRQGRRLSAAARRRISQAAKARWAKVKKAGKKKL